MTQTSTSPEIVLIRHGETEWSRSGRHTGTTDIPLTERGREEAGRLAPLLSGTDFAEVLSSPLQRARTTCELAGLGDRMQIDQDLIEWNYGEYEGLTFDQIRKMAPGWMIFTHGCPGGESPEQVAARADRLIGRLRKVEGKAALFAHGHILRVFAARWIGLPVAAGANLLLDTSTISVLGEYRDAPALKRWNSPVDPTRLTG
jgi:broad specificity phosphatase PhoE